MLQFRVFRQKYVWSALDTRQQILIRELGQLPLLRCRPDSLTETSAAVSRRGRPLSKGLWTTEPVRRESRRTQLTVRRLVLVACAMPLDVIWADMVTHCCFTAAGM